MALTGEKEYREAVRRVRTGLPAERDPSNTMEHETFCICRRLDDLLAVVRRIEVILQDFPKPGAG